MTSKQSAAAAACADTTISLTKYRGNPMMKENAIPDSRKMKYDTTIIKFESRQSSNFGDTMHDKMYVNLRISCVTRR